ncbi:tripartite tricarboxylate transporter TctB family protein [Bacillus sp. FJAT-49705]|uniref:Tripartite tricarboxylate transporter TctB family protein n=1 Tax=Cytobacillus citreus TaxID=2833586 RepID=A0ABS5NWX7_9BACI|nr:tripartite tricarboxylate transporter TctB family protein [Cytobacillus citreus]MBS4192335.1 tripartite tricarboxylate transporter TctB family protein [Cytobacillus citreus]
MRLMNYILGLIMLVLATVFFITANSFKVSTQVDLGPSFFPKLVSIIIILLSITLIVTTASDRKLNQTIGELFEKYELVKVGSVILLLIIYNLLLVSIGFILATILFMFVSLRLLNKKKWSITIPVPILATGIIYYCFNTLLNVQLPSGFW